jgi:hypothetical protein
MTAEQSILTGCGTPPLQAQKLGVNIATGLTAAGTTIADALPLTSKLNVLGTVGSGTGAQLPTVEAGEVVTVKNAGANTLKLYPSGADQKLNGGSDGAAVDVAATETAVCQRLSGTDTLVSIMVLP